MCDVIYFDCMTTHKYVDRHVSKLFHVGNKSQFYKGQVVSFMFPRRRL